MTPVEYIPGFVEDPDQALADLLTIDWKRYDGSPRDEYYCNDFDKPYTYGRGRGKRTYLRSPWPSPISLLRTKIEKLRDTSLEVCFANRYLNQRDQLGWHADDSPEMDDARPIAIISLGVEREIWFRPHEDINAVDKLKLQHGSLCLMLPGMQLGWDHRIPKASFECGTRISLVYRGYVNA